MASCTFVVPLFTLVALTVLLYLKSWKWSENNVFEGNSDLVRDQSKFPQE